MTGHMQSCVGDPGHLLEMHAKAKLAALAATAQSLCLTLAFCCRSLTAFARDKRQPIRTPDKQTCLMQLSNLMSHGLTGSTGGQCRLDNDCTKDLHVSR